MEKFTEDEIAGHMVKKYKGLFKSQTKKPFIYQKKGFANVEHYNRLVKLNSKILDIGTVFSK